MELSLLASTITKYAPLLGAVLTDANPIAGVIVMALAKAFNTTSNPNAIVSSIAADNDAEVKIKQIELEHEQDILKAHIADRNNAREREEKIIALTGKRDWLLDFLAVMVVVGFFVLCVLNYVCKLSDDHIATMLIGQISSGFMLVLGYFFGSSNE